MTRHDGLVQLFNTVKSPIRDGQGQVRMTVGVSRNVTEQKRVQDDLVRYREHLENLVNERTRDLRSLSDQLRIILTSLAEGIIAVDAAGRVQLLNPAAEEQLGMLCDQASGRQLVEVLRLDDEQAKPHPLCPLLEGHGALTGTSHQRTGHGGSSPYALPRSSASRARQRDRYWSCVT